mgnify:CR=1 FL=1
MINPDKLIEDLQEEEQKILNVAAKSRLSLLYHIRHFWYNVAKYL